MVCAIKIIDNANENGNYASLTIQYLLTKSDLYQAIAASCPLQITLEVFEMH